MKFILFVLFILLNYHIGKFIGQTCFDHFTGKYGKTAKIIGISLLISLLSTLIVGHVSGLIFVAVTK